MHYTTEMLQQAAQTLAASFKAAILAQACTSGEVPTIAQLEAEMREALRQPSVPGNDWTLSRIV